MSTRFYFSNAPFSGTLTPSAGWTTTTGYGIGSLKPELLSVLTPTYANFTYSTAQGAATQPHNTLCAQFISDPLPAGSLAGTFSMVALMNEANASHDAFLQVIIRVVSGDLLTVRGTAYSGQTQGTVSATPSALNYELGTGYATRVLSGIALTTTTITAGDRIVVEVGRRSVATVTGATGTASLLIRDQQDVPDQELLVDLSDQVKTWVEFSADLYGSLGVEEYRYRPSGIVLNSSPSVPFVDIRSVSGLDAAPVRSSSTDSEGMHGAMTSAEFETTRTITIEGDIYTNPSASEAYINLLKQNFAPNRRDSPFYFKTDEGVERVVFGKSLGLRYVKDSQRRLGIFQFQVQIECGDPRIYTVSRTLTNIPIPSTGLVVSNGGSRETPLKIRLHGPLTNPIVSLKNPAGFMTLTMTGSIGAGDFYVIDTDARSIVDSGGFTQRTKFALTGTWVNLQAGVSTITTSTSSGAGLCYLSYRQAYQ